MGLKYNLNFQNCKQTVSAMNQRKKIQVSVGNLDGSHGGGAGLAVPKLGGMQRANAVDNSANKPAGRDRKAGFAASRGGGANANAGGAGGFDDMLMGN